MIKCPFQPATFDINYCSHTFFHPQLSQQTAYQVLGYAMAGGMSQETLRVAERSDFIPWQGIMMLTVNQSAHLRKMFLTQLACTLMWLPKRSATFVT